MDDLNRSIVPPPFGLPKEVQDLAAKLLSEQQKMDPEIWRIIKENFRDWI